MKIYFAHSITQYNTKLEKEVINNLKKLFPYATIINPNSKSSEEMYKKYGMEFFLRIVKKCDLVVFTSLFTGKIPAGVSKEVICAYRNDIPVMEMSQLINVSANTMTVEETRDYNIAMEE